MGRQIHPGWFTRPVPDPIPPLSDGPRAKLTADLTPEGRWAFVDEPDLLALGRAWIGPEPVLITDLYGSRITLTRHDLTRRLHKKGSTVVSIERTES